VVHTLQHGGFASGRGPNSPWGASWGPREPPYTLRWERPDAERQPNLSALRSSPGNVATVGRGAS
jgi:hypothetical protein